MTKKEIANCTNSLMSFAFLVLCFLLVFTSSALSQVSFQVTNYNFREAGAGNQNWDIVSDGTEQILVANNLGLLVLKNTDVQFFQLPKRTVFRSVAFINGKIFTGSFEDFGYWEANDSGDLEYSSLTGMLEDPDMNNDEIWKIVAHKGTVYFHSFGSIYAYDGKRVFRLKKEGSYMFPYRVNEQIYIQKVQDSLFTLSENKFTAVPGSDFLSNDEVKSIIELEDNNLLIGSSNGLYVYSGNSFHEWKAERKDEVIRNNINAMVRTRDKIVIGTILNGLYIYDLNSNLLKNISTESQLQNNTILSLAVDPFDNLWVGMDKGLAYIAFDTPVNSYRDALHDIGSVYAASLHRNDLYVGTNQGIYKFQIDKNGKFYNQTLLSGSQGQVWFLKEFDGFLYAGLNDGTYVIKNGKLIKVSSTFGGYNLKAYTRNKSELLLQSSYSDIVVYEKKQALWRQAYTFSGFSSPAKFLEFDPTGNIWLGHTVRGIFRLQPNIKFNNIENVDTIGTSYGLPSESNRVFKVNNRIITSVGDTLYQWNEIDALFEPYTVLDEYFTEKGSVSNIIPTGNQKYWVIKQNELILFEIHFNSIRVLYRILPEMYDFQLVEDYETVIPLNEDLHLICLENGFAILNLKQVNSSKYPEPKVQLQAIETTNLNEKKSRYRITDTSAISFPYSENTINFEWTNSQVVGNRAFFQYKLEGLDTRWSRWSSNTETSYLRLPSGTYTFLIRSIGTSGVLTETVPFSFRVKKPWYFSAGAYFIYAVLIISFLLMIRLYISRKRWKKLGRDLEKRHKKMAHDRDKAEKKIIQLTNEKLKAEIEHKSAQLASNTMAIMRKNNLLSSIKEELEKQKEELGNSMPKKYFNKINNLIGNGIEDEHEWEIFEQLYDQAHGDFFKRFKEKYPQVTPSDLRLCAYLRMNLSSKEIAPLLNISIRGVEERRYRLRKRLDISTDTNLNELIMTF